MSKKKTAAKALLFIGAFGIASQIMQGRLMAYPLTTTMFMLMLVPYSYIQFRSGFHDAKDGTDLA